MAIRNLHGAPMTTPSLADDAALDLACETLYRFLAAALHDPRHESFAVLREASSRALAQSAADFLREQFGPHPVPLGFGEAPAEELDARPLCAQLAQSPQELTAQFLRVFGVSTCRECPPYETEYHPTDDPFFRSQQLADIAGFYRAFGVEPSSRCRERCDFVGLELEFQALLLLKKRQAAAAAPGDGAAEVRAAICQEARTAFFRDHLSWWLPSFAQALRRKAQQGLYEEVGRLLAALLPIERTRLGVSPGLLPREAKLFEPSDPCEGCLANR
jgi:TorA maturation chaperone TorD